MNFFKTVANTFYSPEFYASIPGKKFTSAFWYFSLFSILLLALQSLQLIHPLFVQLPPAITKYTSEWKNAFPQDLVVKIENGQVSTNVHEPYFVAVPSESTQSAKAQNVIVIDTKTPYSATQFKDYSTYAWLTKDSIFYHDNNKISSFPLTDVKNFELSKANIDDWYALAVPYFKYVSPVLFALALLAFYSAISTRLIYLLVTALLIMLVASFFERKLSYGNAYKVGLYALTPALLISTVISSLHSWIGFNGFPFMVTLLMLVFVAINFAKAKNTTP